MRTDFRPELFPSSSSLQLSRKIFSTKWERKPCQISALTCLLFFSISIDDSVAYVAIFFLRRVKGALNKLLDPLLILSIDSLFCCCCLEMKRFFSKIQRRRVSEDLFISILFLFAGKMARGDVKLFIFFFLMIYIMHRLSISRLGTGGMGSAHTRTFFFLFSFCFFPSATLLEVMKMLLSVVFLGQRRMALVLLPPF